MTWNIWGLSTSAVVFYPHQVRVLESCRTIYLHFDHEHEHHTNLILFSESHHHFNSPYTTVNSEASKFLHFFHFAMAARFAMVRSTGGKMGSILGFRRWIHSVPQSPPLAGGIDNGVPSSQPVLPEFTSPSFSFGGSMELMAVPKRKVSRHKRGIRNGPKALKPVPVIVLCKSCGRAKLPHFYCCGGNPNKGNTDSN